MLLKRLFSKIKTYYSTNKTASTIENMPPVPLSVSFDYDAAIAALNKLQTNAKYIKVLEKSDNEARKDIEKLDSVEKYLSRAGLALDKIDKLSVIHVAGTKGKGTTCAFTEAILRQHGYKTGFYSSPHLFEVRERIRIDGKPIGKSDFARYFWQLYHLLDSQKSCDQDMPHYFRFLTIMALSIFLEQQVDVAIVEVGIGGEFDCTNILRKVPVVGITSLGIDHTVMLGTTLESIAWHKAGIMKPGSQVFTVPQEESAMKVLKARSIEKKSNFLVVDTSEFCLKSVSNASFPMDIFNTNASLAVALSEAWISSSAKTKQQLCLKVTQMALDNCSWPGRYQILRDKNVTYYLDGAHTVESMAICAHWFKNRTKLPPKRGKKALMFNVIGDRNVAEFHRLLRPCRFDVVLFVPNVAVATQSNDTIVVADNNNDILRKCENNKDLWQSSMKQAATSTTDHDNGVVDDNQIVLVFPTVMQAIQYLNDSGCSYDLLVTGSLHLIGATLTILDPEMNNFQ